MAVKIRRHPSSSVMSRFRVYRILCSTSPDLDPERQTFETTLAEFAENVTFPEQVLFAGASFRESFDTERHRASAEANVRMCDFFLHIFSETWPGSDFQAYVELARECLSEPSQPMRQVAVLYKNFGEADDEVRRFRAVLAEAGNCELRDFQNPLELEGILQELYASWWELVQPRP
jgi:hypothetical protein